jgi:protein phosphatase
MIPAERAHLYVAARSHPGMSGKNNEDRYGVSAHLLDLADPVPSVLAIVADGIGGHRAGEIAAEIAVETISQEVSNGNSSLPAQTLAQAIVQASQAIYEQSLDNPERKGMGATCVCAWIIGDRLYAANVGDSRIYLVRAGTIRQLSTDHTWIQEALDQGALTPEQVQGHPNVHVIRRYLGSRQTVVPDLRLRLGEEESNQQSEANQGVRLQPGDRLLLCSDGLTDLVKDTEILSILTTFKQEEALDLLVSLANQRGGHDNITLVTLQVPETVALPAELQPVSRWQRRRVTCLGFAALTVLGLLLIGGISWLMQRSPSGATDPANMTPLAHTATLQAANLPTGQASPTLALAAPITMTPAKTGQPVAGTRTVQAVFTLTPWPTNTGSP